MFYQNFMLKWTYGKLSGSWWINEEQQKPPNWWRCRLVGGRRQRSRTSWTVADTWVRIRREGRAGRKDPNYHPNTVARQLYKQRPTSSGWFFPTVDNFLLSAGGWNRQSSWKGKAIRCWCATARTILKWRSAYLKNLLTRQIDGLIIGSHNQHLRGYQHSELPIVAIDKNIDENVPVVSWQLPGRNACDKRLIADGCRHIFHTNGPLEFDSPVQERRRAFEQVMDENEMPAITYHLGFNATLEEKERVFSQLFTEHPEVDGIGQDDMDEFRFLCEEIRQEGAGRSQDYRLWLR